MASILSFPHFHSEEAAYAYVEARLWPDGPVCPKCGATKEHVGRLRGQSTRIGLCKCYACRKPFTVKVGTIFESSHCPLRFWLQAIHLLCSSKKGISTRQLQRTLGVGMKTAWFLGHRIRAAMDPGGSAGPMGGEGKTIEADETYFGPKVTRFGRKPRAGYGAGSKSKIVALVERGGTVRSFKVDHANTATVRKIVKANVERGGRLMTDESGLYNLIGSPWAGYFTDHGRVMHTAGEYVKRGTDIHTNTIEGFFSIFKRGMRGIYQQCGERHLHRYLAEFDFRYSNRQKLGVDDVQRADRALKGVKGKRLTYQTTRGA